MGCFIAPYFASHRVALPELVGDDEQTVAQANAFVEGAQQLARLLGPVPAGALIVASSVAIACGALGSALFFVGVVTRYRASGAAVVEQV